MDYSADTHALVHNVDVAKVKQKHTAGLNMPNDGAEKEVGDSAIVKLFKSIILSRDNRVWGGGGGG